MFNNNIDPINFTYLLPLSLSVFSLPSHLKNIYTHTIALSTVLLLLLISNYSATPTSKLDLSDSESWIERIPKSKIKKRPLRTGKQVRIKSTIPVNRKVGSGFGCDSLITIQTKPVIVPCSCCPPVGFSLVYYFLTCFTGCIFSFYFGSCCRLLNFSCHT